MDVRTTHPTTSTKSQLRLDSLTGLRWIAAFGVFLHHVWEGSPFTNVGLLGVTFFFVLSGFVLAWGSNGRPSPMTFYRNRVARIVPTMMVAVLAGAVVTKMQGWQLVLSLLGLQGWSSNKAVYYGGNGVVWSLTCELFFYLTFPLAIRLLTRMTLAQRRWFAVALIAASILLRVLLGAWEGIEHQYGFRYWLLDVYPVTRLPEFLIGIILALEVREGLRVKYATELGFLGLTLVAAYATLGDLRLWWNLLMLAPVVLLILGTAQASLRGQSSWLSSKVMIQLGELSFCFYLFHWVFVGLFPVMAVPFMPVFLASLLVSVVVHHAIEKPSNRLIRG